MPSRTPQIDYKVIQAETITVFVGEYTLGLFGSNGCGYAAVDEGHGIVSADRIRTHT